MWLTLMSQWARISWPVDLPGLAQVADSGLIVRLSPGVGDLQRPGRLSYGGGWLPKGWRTPAARRWWIHSPRRGGRGHPEAA